MPTISLFAEGHLPLDMESLVSGLNARCDYLRFKAGESEFRIETDEVSLSCSYAQLDQRLLDEAEGDLLTILFTDTPYDNNFFFESSNNISIVSLSQWDYLTSLPMNNGVVYFVADLLAMEIDDSYRHEDTTGCVYDFAWNKTAIDRGMRFAYICPRCRTRIGTLKLRKSKKDILADLRHIFDSLGAASRWDEDIVTYWETCEPTKRSDGEALTSGTIVPPTHFVPEDDPNDFIDVRRRRLSLLCQCYLDLTDPALPRERKGRTFEEFSKALFGLIRGWRELEANARLEDCEVDIIYDISGGPRVLRDWMGNNLYVECKHRSAKSEVKDISHFVMNLRTRGLTSGVFFSYGGIAGYDPLNWKKIEHAYRRIIDVARQDQIYVVPLVGEDVEAVKNGMNLVDHIVDLLNRFVRV